jgi:hypothetical protein
LDIKGELEAPQKTTDIDNTIAMSNTRIEAYGYYPPGGLNLSKNNCVSCVTIDLSIS